MKLPHLLPLSVSWIGLALFPALFPTAVRSQTTPTPPSPICLGTTPGQTIQFGLTGSTFQVIPCPTPVAGPPGPQGPIGLTGPVGPTGPPGANGTGTGTLTGVQLSTLPANSLAIALPDGTYLPVVVVTPATTIPAAAQVQATIATPTPVGAGLTVPAIAAFVNLTDPTGVSANNPPVALFSFYTAFPNLAIWNPVTLQLYGNGTPSSP
jgi:hypothetical protein